MYKYVGKFWKDRRADNFKKLEHERYIYWRREHTVTRIERPTRIDRARALGYRAKQGFVLVRTKVRRASMRKIRPVSGRQSRGQAVNKVQPGKNLRWIAEERTARKYPNLEVLNSYQVGEDGRFKWYEIILIDTEHPVIINDPKINWICRKSNKSRVFKGLTGAGKKSRGLYNKGKGAEKMRPSLRAHDRKGK